MHACMYAHKRRQQDTISNNPECIKTPMLQSSAVIDSSHTWVEVRGLELDLLTFTQSRG